MLTTGFTLLNSGISDLREDMSQRFTAMETTWRAELHGFEARIDSRLKHPDAERLRSIKQQDQVPRVAPEAIQPQAHEHVKPAALRVPPEGHRAPADDP